jgi:sodium transport system permease protein
MQEAFLNAAEGTRQVRILELQMIYLLATVATPALMMAAVLTADFRRTLKLYWPGWRMLATSALLAALLLPVSQELIRALEGWFFPQLPEEAARLLEALHDPKMSIWLPLLAFAVAPAICEELAFRGFILSGLQRSGRLWLPILLSSVAFGVVHMIPQQVFNATLLGIVLGIMAVRSGSLIPGVVFHLLFNGAQVVLARVNASPLENGVGRWLFTVEQAGEHTSLRYDWPLLVICVVLAAVLLRWIFRQQPKLPPAAPVPIERQPAPRETERETQLQNV